LLFNRIKAFTDENGRAVERTVDVIGLPDHCPICHRFGTQEQVAARLDGLLQLDRLQVVYKCPNTNCVRLFIATFRLGERPGGAGGPYFFEKCLPAEPEPVKFPSEIANLSPRFIEIYAAAMTAAANGLTDLEGMGIRKALEFLIKDYAIAGHADEADKIRKMDAADVVNKYSGDEGLKAAAKRAFWLANDETHYTRRWEAKDVEDLKKLVRITVAWIERELVTADFIESMPDRRRPEGMPAPGSGVDAPANATIID
jgi:hypothetical protein